MIMYIMIIAFHRIRSLVLNFLIIEPETLKPVPIILIPKR